VAVASLGTTLFLRHSLQTVFNGWLEREDRTSFGFDRRGFSLNVIKPMSPGLVLLGTVSWSRTKLTHLEIAESEVDRQLLPFATMLA
jgi:hypothetical protein